MPISQMRRPFRMSSSVIVARSQVTKNASSSFAPISAPANALGHRSVMFTVESVDDTVARLRANGAELVGEVVQYEDMYRLCYMRGPVGIIVALAEELLKRSPPSEKPGVRAKPQGTT